MLIFLQKDWQKKGHKVRILTGRIERTALRIEPKIKLISPPKLVNGLIQNNFLYFIVSLPIISLLLLKYSKDVEVIETEGGFSLWASVMIGKLRNAKIVWSVHVCKEKSGSGVVKDWLFLPFRILDNYFAKKAACVKTITLENARCLRNIFGLRNIKIFLPPVDFARLQNPKPKRVIEKHKLKDKIVLLLPATLHRLKNQELAINSLKEVLKVFSSCVLILVGEGLDKERLKGLVEQKGLKGKVIFAGVAKNEEIADYYKVADLVLVPSYLSEGLPIVPFEALYLGAVSVVSKGSGADKFFKKEGIGLVASPNISDFSRAILDYLLHPFKFEKLKKMGKAWVLKEMPPDKLVEDNLKFYKSVLGRDK